MARLLRLLGLEAPEALKSDSVRPQRQTLGQRGEDLACAYLRSLGFQILARNYRVRCGEIDLIAEDNGELVFVEVKARASETHGHPAEAVTPRKQQQLARVALDYLSRQQKEQPARFDVVTVRFGKGASPELELIKAAFELQT